MTEREFKQLLADLDRLGDTPEGRAKADDLLVTVVLDMLRALAGGRRKARPTRARSFS